ncbi:NACHT, LRR and PYD domains-containing protein 12-like isoform 2-T3 [Aplochiton taeniatus]
MKSDRSMEHPTEFKDGHHSTDQREHQERPEVPSGQSVQGHQTDLASIFTLLEDRMITLVKKELKRFQRILCPDYPECIESQREEEEEEQGSSAREGALKITLHLLRNMKQQALADTLEKNTSTVVCQRRLKTNLKKKFECVFEGIATEGNSTLLNQIYTDVYMTEGGSGELNTQHEVRHIETASRKPVRPETPIRVHDIFKGPPGRDKPIRTVLTKGVAGIGKTVCTQKFTLDWADGKTNKDIQFTLPLSFRELNLLKWMKCSFIELLYKFFVEMKELEATNFDKYKVVFVFDGLDECRLPLDFQNNEIWTDVTEPTSVDVLLTNLIKGNLLPSAQLWITTRPAAANQIPPECVCLVTEVRGFTDPQKDMYFTKRFNGKENMASSVISHVKTSRSLHIMCHIPVFCYITAKVLEHMLTTDQRGELPKTLTEMYIHFLVFQSKQGNVKDNGRAEADSHWNTESGKIILSLGKLAFEQLEKGNLIFYESDVTECGIDVRAASVCSGVFTQIFREERGLYQSQNKVFCFVHLSIQEFLAAVYVILSFFNDKQNVLDEPPSLSYQSLHSVHMVAVDMALQSENGHWDLFLRFLLGLSLETNQRLLQGLLKQTGSNSETNNEEIRKTVEYIKNFLEKKDICSERSINLIHCLNELGDTSLVKEVQGFLTRGGFQLEDLSASQSSALVFVLVTSEEELDVFDLKKYSKSEAGLLKLLPVLEAKAPRRLLLSGGTATEKGFASLASALRSFPSHLRELDLSFNHPGDSGVKLLSALLEDPQCRLETLRLSGCMVTEAGCTFLASALSSNPSHLRELDLSYNHPGDSGVKLLSALLEEPQCRLETLRLSGCMVTEAGCAFLASALSSNPSHLRELDVSYNHPGDSGVKLLSALLEEPQCRLEILRLSDCLVTKEGCASMVSAVKANFSHLRELDVSNNDLQDSGVKLLSDELSRTTCKLETLRLSGCMVTETGCAFLASALSSNPSHLRELDLSYNHPGDSGVKLLSALLDDPHRRLETLRVDHGGGFRIKPGPTKYACDLSLDPNTAQRNLSLSEENRKVTRRREEQLYPDHPERFDYWRQVLCKGLTGSHGQWYWEVERRGWVDIGVTYRGINRRGEGEDCLLGFNTKSWSLDCNNNSYSARHNKKETVSPVDPSGSTRVGVYLDCPGGTLSFYRVSSDTLTLIHTFHSTFTEPLYPGFRLWWEGSSVTLCQK